MRPSFSNFWYFVKAVFATSVSSDGVGDLPDYIWTIVEVFRREVVSNKRRKNCIEGRRLS